MALKKGQQVLNTQLLPVNKVKTNTGQIPGLPRNPRTIRDARFAALKRSIQDFPEMMELREVIVFPYRGFFVAIGGNQRLLACKDLGYKEVPAKVLPKTTPVTRLAEFALKDNANFGEDDLDALTAEWQEFPIEEWGIEIPDLGGVDIDDFFKEDTTEKNLAVSHNITLSYANEAECEEVKAKLLARADTFEAAVALLLAS